jgi:NDP-sugar pyrophosphorylase family protein
VSSIRSVNQALILAGGEGTRLQPITKKIPKPMVEINNKPFLEHQLELLAKNEITKAILCVGYLWEQIKEYFGDAFIDKAGNKIKLLYSVEPRFLGTGGAIKNAETFIDDYFFVVYGDTYLPINYIELGKLIIEKNTTGVISVYKNTDKIVENNIRTDSEGYITEYNKVHENPEMNGVDAGAAVYSEDLLEFLPESIPENQKISLEVDIYPKLINKHQLFGFLTEVRFYDMGTFERIETITEVLK